MLQQGKSPYFIFTIFYIDLIRKDRKKSLFIATISFGGKDLY
jgi:hypothetical protein